MRVMLFICDMCGAEKRIVKYNSSKTNGVQYCPTQWRLFGTRWEMKSGAMALLCPDCCKKIKIKTTASQRDPRSFYKKPRDKLQNANLLLKE